MWWGWGCQRVHLCILTLSFLPFFFLFKFAGFLIHLLQICNFSYDFVGIEKKGQNMNKAHYHSPYIHPRYQHIGGWCRDSTGLKRIVRLIKHARKTSQAAILKSLFVLFACHARTCLHVILGLSSSFKHSPSCVTVGPIATMLYNKRGENVILLRRSFAVGLRPMRHQFLLLLLFAFLLSKQPPLQSANRV